MGFPTSPTNGQRYPSTIWGPYEYNSTNRVWAIIPERITPAIADNANTLVSVASISEVRSIELHVLLTNGTHHRSARVRVLHDGTTPNVSSNNLSQPANPNSLTDCSFTAAISGSELQLSVNCLSVGANPICTIERIREVPV